MKSFKQVKVLSPDTDEIALAQLQRKHVSGENSELSGENNERLSHLQLLGESP